MGDIAGISNNGIMNDLLEVTIRWLVIFSEMPENCAFRDYKLKKIAGPITQVENVRRELRKQL